MSGQQARWYQAHCREKAVELEAQRQEWLREWFKHNRGDMMGELEYVRLRLSQEVNDRMLRDMDIQVLADQRRTRDHKALGKQYGKASRTIRELRGEIALLREQLRAGSSHR